MDSSFEDVPSPTRPDQKSRGATSQEGERKESSVAKIRKARVSAESKPSTESSDSDESSDSAVGKLAPYTGAAAHEGARLRELQQSVRV